MLLALAVVGAVVPALLLVRYFHAQDPRPEPHRVLWTTFGLGLLSALPVMFVAGAIGAALGAPAAPLRTGLTQAFLAAAIPEEAFKFLVLLLYCSRHREFDEPVDGMVYGAVASLGFAAVENVLYVIDGGLGVALLRAFSAVPAHAFLGAIMGAYIGLARFAGNRQLGLLFRGLIVPIGLHGLYDFPLIVLQQLDAGGEPAAVPAYLPVALRVLAIGVLFGMGERTYLLFRRLRAMRPPSVVPES